MVLATASIMPNRLEDFRGYMEFIQADPDLWERIDEWGVSDIVNPYALDDNHPAAALQLTYQAMRKFIIEPSQHDHSKIKSGLYLRKALRKLMICRTYASKHPRYPDRNILTPYIPILLPASICILTCGF